METRELTCIGCPMGNNKEELERLPEFKKLYLRSFEKMLQRFDRSDWDNTKWQTAEDGNEN